ncbi:MAG: TldD/PmbA family protein [Bryobacteraceae bacterium]|nr:TldD/PmbA family protein [Bryobacteraceae bacterium]
MITREEAQKLCQQALSLTSFPECHATLTSSEQAYTRFANNGITTASFNLRHSLSIVVTREGRSGSVSVNDLDLPSLKNAMKQAEELAAIAPVNSERLPALGPQEFPATFDLDERTAAARAPEMIPHVKTIIDAALQEKMVAAGLIERTHRVTTIANKAGLFGYHRSSDSQLTTTIRQRDGSSSGWAGQPSMKLAALDSPSLARTAIEKCKRWKNPQKLTPGNYTVVLEPTATGDLVRLITNGFSARNTEEGRTFLSKRGGGSLLGEKVFPEFVTLRMDPFDPRQPSSPWTNDYLPNRAITWIDHGKIANLAYDRYWAWKTGQPATPAASSFGRGAGSLIMEGADATLQQLIASVERGLLVTHLWYIRPVNPQTLQQTGLTRDGLFLIENGEITTPVMNMRFLESPVRLLKNTQRLGQAVRVRGLEGGIMIAPALIAKDFPLPSISDAV